MSWSTPGIFNVLDIWNGGTFGMVAGVGLGAANAETNAAILQQIIWYAQTHASLLAKHGVALEVVSNRLGHSAIGITADRYLHIYRSRDAQAAAVFEQLAS